jgi:hypothetical protein
MLNTKICNKCKTEKPLTKEFFVFRKDRQIWDSPCKSCMKVARKLYRLKNLSEIKKRQALYRKKNEDKIKKYRQEYYLKNKERINKNNKIYNDNNKEKLSKYKKDWANKNKEKIRNRNKEYYANNKDKIKANVKEWTINNKRRSLDYHNNYNKNKRLNDPSFRFRCSISSQIRFHIKKNNGYKSGASILDHLPYTIQELKEHLERNFKDWMTWDNYGVYNSNMKTWQIDHIIPQSKLPYDSMTHPNFLKCWSLDNLMPLEAIKNIIKSNKIVL